MAINQELLKIARYAVQRKEAFVDAATAGGGDPAAAAAGGDPAAAGMDPSMMGMDPAAMGMDPAAMGGAPPPPGGGGVDMNALQTMIQSTVQAAMQGQGGGAGAGAAGAGGLKPKIDVNVALMQLSKMVARIADTLGVSIPASEMIATAPDLNQMAQQQQQQQAPQQGAIQPLQGLQPAFGGGAPGGGGGGGSGGGEKSGSAFDGRGLTTMSDRAAGLAEVLRKRHAA